MNRKRHFSQHCSTIGTHFPLTGPTNKRMNQSESETSDEVVTRELIPHEIFYQPHIIETIFDNLGPLYVHRCARVCKDWYREAVRWFDKQHVDTCSLVWKDMTPEMKSIRRNQESSQQILETLELTQSSSKWFFNRGADYLPIREVDIGGYVEDFFEMRNCPPSLIFICLDNRFECIADVISPKFPAIVLKQAGLKVSSYSQRMIWTGLSTFIRKPLFFESTSSGMSGKNTAYKCFEAFRINRDSPNSKIIVTDWSDPNSEKPSLHDPNYPVKAFILLMGHPWQHERKLHDFLLSWPSRLSGNVSGNISGGQVDYFLGSNLSFYYPNSRTLSPSKAISIAFAGHGVQSAVYLFSQIFKPNALSVYEQFLREAREFRDNLSFPIDDGRVLGFIFEYCYGWCDYFPDIFEKIVELFPCIRLIRVKCRETRRMSTLLIHLIRI